MPNQLPSSPNVDPEFLSQVARDYDRFTHEDLPHDLTEFFRNEYLLEVSSEYAGLAISNPWGKASGQLSMTANQVAEDVDAGLGFVVLKTVIAQDEAGEQSMSAWAVRESRMVAERITGQSGESGWTVSWKGRGWWQSFDEYLALIRDACRVSGGKSLIVPSCKYHLPNQADEPWRSSEYRFTTSRILDVWQDTCDGIMPLEKDFSPTLAGSDLATQQNSIMNWMRQVPTEIRSGAGARAEQLRVGLKVFNAMFDDDFQLSMLKTIHQAEEFERANFFVYGNRLFDPNKVFDGHRGIAYGGPDLSDRNLRVMSEFNQLLEESELDRLPWSATGNITTGKMAIEYALVGATSFQLHTFFQLPADQYSKKTGSRTQRALHELYFNPEHGFLVWLEHLYQKNVTKDRVTNWREVVEYSKPISESG
jgi:hypothetical protein